MPGIPPITFGASKTSQYGPAAPLDHSGMTNEAFDQYYEDIANIAAQKQRAPKKPNAVVRFIKAQFAKLLQK